MSYTIRKNFLHVKDDNGNWITVNALADPEAGAALAESISQGLQALTNANYISSTDNVNLSQNLTVTGDVKLTAGNLLFSNAGSSESQNGIRWLVSRTLSGSEVTQAIYHELDTDSNQVLELRYHTYNFENGNVSASSPTPVEILRTNGSTLNLCGGMTISSVDHSVTLSSGDLTVSDGSVQVKDNLTLTNGNLIVSTGGITVEQDVKIKEGNLFFSDTNSTSSTNGIRWLMSNAVDNETLHTSHKIYYEIDTDANHKLKFKTHKYYYQNNAMTSSDSPETFITLDNSGLTLKAPSITMNSNDWELVESSFTAGGSLNNIPPILSGTGDPDVPTVYQLNITHDNFYIIDMWMTGCTPTLFTSGTAGTPCGIILKDFINDTYQAFTADTTRTLHVLYLKKKIANLVNLGWASSNNT